LIPAFFLPRKREDAGVLLESDGAVAPAVPLH
jgi:hypothetical protein